MAATLRFFDFDSEANAGAALWIGGMSADHAAPWLGYVLLVESSAQRLPALVGDEEVYSVLTMGFKRVEIRGRELQRTPGL